jgi:hypothetical protein
VLRVATLAGLYAAELIEVCHLNHLSFQHYLTCYSQHYLI